MLKNKLALITGGGSGIGRAVCQVFASQGASVIVADVHEANASETRKSLHAATSGQQQQHSTFVVDVGCSKSIDRFFVDVGNKYQNRCPEVIVNAAGIILDGKLHDTTEQRFDRVIEVNLKGPFLISKLFSKSMIDQKVHGSIINISSLIGKVGNYGQSNYAASKAGLIGMTKSIAKELASSNIRCNAVLPGFIETPMTAPMPREFIEKFRQHIPMQRLGKPEEVAQACLFLASDMSLYVTGFAMEVSGGLFM